MFVALLHFLNMILKSEHSLSSIPQHKAKAFQSNYKYLFTNANTIVCDIASRDKNNHD